MRSSSVDRALHGHAQPEVVMLRFQATLAAALFAAGCSAACAGDFLPRAASGGLATVADDPGARPTCPDVASAAMSESVSIATPSSAASSRSTPTPASAQRAAHVGTDEVAAETHAAAGDDDKSGGAAPVSPHKSKGGMRWQSLLPGVMK
jgi:hypothetical protein